MSIRIIRKPIFLRQNIYRIRFLTRVLVHHVWKELGATFIEERALIPELGPAKAHDLVKDEKLPICASI